MQWVRKGFWGGSEQPASGEALLSVASFLDPRLLLAVGTSATCRGSQEWKKMGSYSNLEGNARNGSVSWKILERSLGPGAH
jgi:hypothetical protein